MVIPIDQGEGGIPPSYNSVNRHFPEAGRRYFRTSARVPQSSTENREIDFESWKRRLGTEPETWNLETGNRQLGHSISGLHNGSPPSEW